MPESLPSGAIIPVGADRIDESGVAAIRALGISIDAVLAGKAAKVHTHQMDEVVGLLAALAGKVASTDPRLTDARQPLAHAHAVSDVTGLRGELTALADRFVDIATAYDVYVQDAAEAGEPVMSRADWLASLVGPQGDEGPYGGTTVTDPQVAQLVETSTATREALLTALTTTGTRPTGKGEFVVAARDYGATGDGTTDDTAALTAAMTAAVDLGRDEVYLHEGTYSVGATVIDGLTLSGPGRLLWRESAPARTPFLTLRGGASLRGVTVDGQRAVNARDGAREDALVWIEATSHGSAVTDCTLVNSPGSAVWAVRGCEHGRVIGNYIRNAKIYNIGVAGSGWVILGNQVLGGSNGVRVGSWLSDWQANPDTPLMHGVTILGNTFYGTSSNPVEVEIQAHGTVFMGNTARFCNSVTKIQYQPGEPVYNTVFANNTFYRCNYPVTFNDADGTVTQHTEQGMNSEVPFGGINSIVTGNILDEVAGVQVRGGTHFSGNRLLNIGADTSGKAAIRIMDAESDGVIVSDNTLTLHPSRQMQDLIRIDVPNVIVQGNRLSGATGVVNLIAVRASNARIQGNVIRDSAGSFYVPSNVTGIRIVDNTITGIADPYAQVNRSGGTVISRNTGGGATPDMTTLVNANGNTLTIAGAGKHSVGTGVDGSTVQLSTIEGGQPGDLLILQRRASNQTVVVAGSGGNVRLAGPDLTLAAGVKIALVYDGAQWLETGRF